MPIVDLRFLIDEALSPRIAESLQASGYDAVHVRDVRMRGKPDRQILLFARQSNRTIITQDTDFGALLAAERAIRPSVIRLRMRDGRPAGHADRILEVVPRVANDIACGSAVVVTEGRVRVRRLPIY